MQASVGPSSVPAWPQCAMASYLANHPTERLVATDLGSLPLFVGCIQVFWLPLPMFEILGHSKDILWNTNMLVLLPQKFHHTRFPGRGNCDLRRITQWRETNASTVCFNLNAVWELPADAGYNWEIRETQARAQGPGLVIHNGWSPFLKWMVHGYEVKLQICWTLEWPNFLHTHHDV